MATLPTPGSDSGTWGTELNTWLEVAHNSDGTAIGLPWQFRVDDYGAVGDGVIGTGGTGTSGDATFTDSGAHWTSADIGKAIVVNQGTVDSGSPSGTAQDPFCGTISSINSSTSIELSGNLAADAASAPYIYGTDDVSAIQDAIDAAGTYAAANGWIAEVIFSPKIYMLMALVQQTSPDKRNAHLTFPYGTQTGQRLALRFTGVGAPHNQYWESESPQLNGPCLVSAVFPPDQPDATFGQMSILGGPTAQLGSGEFANVRLEVEGITFVAPWNSQMYGVDGRWIAQMIVPSAQFMAFVPTNVEGASIGGPYSQKIPTNTVAAGFAYPWASNNAANFGGLVVGLTVPYAVMVSEHTTFTRLSGFYGTSACYITSTPSVPHALTIQHLCSEGSVNALDASDSGITGTTFPVNIGMIETEDMTNSIVNDPNNILTGVVYAGAGGASFVTVIGGERLTVLDVQLHDPGPWSGAPSEPSSGTAQQNLSYRYATIYARAVTSITSFAVGPDSGSMTTITVNAGAGIAIPIRVPPGWFWSATYSGTLTAPWMLD